MEPEATKALVVVYLFFLAAVALERFSSSGPFSELARMIELHRAAHRAADSWRRDYLTMAFKVWETTGERIDRA